MPSPSSTAEAPATEFDHLAGLIERVTFHNEQNGFCVLMLYYATTIYKSQGSGQRNFFCKNFQANSSGWNSQSFRLR
jgi:hypothetical protein